MIYFIGIDLAWTKNGDTGVCVLDENGEIILWEVAPHTNHSLIQSISLYIKHAAIISIDAPISVPNEKGSRASENELKRTKIHEQRVAIFSTNRTFMVQNFGSVRGEEIVALIEEINPQFKYNKQSDQHFIFETFPTANCVGIFKKKIAYKATSGKKAAVLDGIDTLLKAMKKHPWFAQQFPSIEKKINTVLDNQPSKKDLKLLDDQIDALLCAYTAFQYFNDPQQIRSFGIGRAQLIIAYENA